MKSIIVEAERKDKIPTNQTGSKSVRVPIAFCYLVPPVLSLISHLTFGYQGSILAALIFRWPLLSLAFDFAVPVLLTIYSVSEGLAVTKGERRIEYRSTLLKLSTLTGLSFTLAVLPGVIKAGLAGLMIVASIIVVAYELSCLLFRLIIEFLGLVARTAHIRPSPKQKPA
jgi:hypothetical protein